MEKDGNIRAISRGLAVLQAINRNRSMTMTEIASTSGIPYPTACRIVQTLIEEGMVERETARKRYRPTALVQTLSLGYQAEDRLVTIARPHLVQLTNRLVWPVSICSRVGMNMMVRDSTHTLTSLTFNIYHPGYTLPLLESASGKAYLAFCPPVERDAILRGIRQLHPDAVRTEGAIEKLLADVRKLGYAVQGRNRHTANPGKTSSIAAPVMESGRVVAGLSIIFFASALSMDSAVQLLAEPLKEAARTISADLSAGGGGPVYADDATLENVLQS